MAQSTKCGPFKTVGAGFSLVAAGLIAFGMVLGIVVFGTRGGVATPVMDSLSDSGTMGVMKVAGSFKDENNIALIQEILLVQSGEQAGEMFDGMVIAGADLLLIAALLSLKTHMAMKRSSDETELIMMTCFIIGLTLPFVDFLLSAGPRSVVGWIAGMAQLPADDTSAPLNVWNDFSDSDWRSLYLIYTVTESLFLWTNIMAMGLQGIGFLLLSSIGNRAGAIWCSKLSLVSKIVGGMLVFGFLCGMMQEISPIFGIGYYLMQFLGSQIGVMVFLVLLGQGMGKVDSLGMQQGLFAAEAPPPASDDMEAPAADAPGATETL